MRSRDFRRAGCLTLINNWLCNERSLEDYPTSDQRSSMTETESPIYSATLTDVQRMRVKVNIARLRDCGYLRLLRAKTV